MKVALATSSELVQVGYPLGCAGVVCVPHQSPPTGDIENEHDLVTDGVLRRSDELSFNTDTAHLQFGLRTFAIFPFLFTELSITAV